MKKWSMKLLSVLLIIAMLPFSALADDPVSAIDLPSMTDEQLYQLLDSTRQELAARNRSYVDKSVPLSAIYSEIYTMSGFMGMDLAGADNEYHALNDDYAIEYYAGLRMVTYRNRVMKISVLYDPKDTEGTVLRMYLLASVMEPPLYELKTVTASDKHAAFNLADDIVNTAFDIFGKEMKKVITSDQDGLRMMASMGRIPYYWERLDGQVWFSASWMDLPEGVQ